MNHTKIIDATIEQKPEDFMTAFNTAMMDKIEVALSNKKQEMVSNMFSIDEPADPDLTDTEVEEILSTTDEE